VKVTSFCINVVHAWKTFSETKMHHSICFPKLPLSYTIHFCFWLCEFLFISSIVVNSCPLDGDFGFGYVRWGQVGRHAGRRSTAVRFARKKSQNDIVVTEEPRVFLTRFGFFSRRRLNVSGLYHFVLRAEIRNG